MIPGPSGSHVVKSHRRNDDVTAIEITYHLASLPAPAPEVKSEVRTENRIKCVLVALEVSPPKRLEVKIQELTQAVAWSERPTRSKDPLFDLAPQLGKSHASRGDRALLVLDDTTTPKKDNVCRMRIDLEEPTPSTAPLGSGRRTMGKTFPFQPCRELHAPG